MGFWVPGTHGVSQRLPLSRPQGGSSSASPGIRPPQPGEQVPGEQVPPGAPPLPSLRVHSRASCWGSGDYGLRKPWNHQNIDVAVRGQLKAIPADPAQPARPLGRAPDDPVGPRPTSNEKKQSVAVRGVRAHLCTF